ncbi:MAG: TlpA family protein disulfide reductase [bacterium]
MKTVKFTLILTLFFSTFALLANKTEAEGLKKGDKIVDFGMRMADVEKGKLSTLVWLGDFVGKKDSKEKKKVLVLNFFANWCDPCIKEMPVLQGLYEKYSEKGLMILSVNFRTDSEKFDETFKKSLQIIKKNGVKYPVLFDRFTNRNQLVYMGAKAVLPCLIVIDSEGIIIEKFQGEESHNLKKIEKVIKKSIGEEPI